MGLVLGEYVDLCFNLIEENSSFFLSFFFFNNFFWSQREGEGEIQTSYFCVRHGLQTNLEIDEIMG